MGRDGVPCGHYLPISAMHNVANRDELLAEGLQATRRMSVPAGALLLWDTRTIHQGWEGGAKKRTHSSSVETPEQKRSPSLLCAFCRPTPCGACLLGTTGAARFGCETSKGILCCSWCCFVALCHRDQRLIRTSLRFKKFHSASGWTWRFSSRRQFLPCHLTRPPSAQLALNHPSHRLYDFPAPQMSLGGRRAECTQKSRHAGVRK